MSDSAVSRRSFIRSTSATAAALSAAGPALGAIGANEKIRVGSIGVGGQGTFHLNQLRKFKDVEVLAVCDVDPVHIKRAAKIYDNKPKQTKEYREVIDNKDVDAIFIATCGHWHAIPALEAMQAGKDLYCEKPMGHTVHEGRLMADAQKKYKRVFQTGTQQRSGPHWANARKRIKDGEIGQITTINVWNAWNMKEMGGNKLGIVPDSDPPAGVDYDRWLGPAPKRPFNKARWHFTFYFHFDYSGGMVSAWAVHLFDVVTWYLAPAIKSVSSVGGIYALKDARETPDTVQSVFDCGDYVMTYSMRHANGWRLHDDMDHGIEFIGTKGVLHTNRRGFKLFREADRAKRKPYYTEKAAGEWGNSLYQHKKNFFDCMRSRKQTNVDATAGHLGAIPGHLANISCRVGRRIVWDAKNETIPGDPEAAKLLTKAYRSPYVLPKV